MKGTTYAGASEMEIRLFTCCGNSTVFGRSLVDVRWGDFFFVGDFCTPDGRFVDAIFDAILEISSTSRVGA